MGVEDKYIVKIFDKKGHMLYQRACEDPGKFFLAQNVFLMAADEKIQIENINTDVITMVFMSSIQTVKVFKIMLEGVEDTG